jgi:hypothetical protein
MPERNPFIEESKRLLIERGQDAVGYVLVSQTHHILEKCCGKPNCGLYPLGLCPIPGHVEPAGQRRCTPYRGSRDCAAYQRWYTEHHEEIPTGGTRLGPLHYFSDCRTLLYRGPRRKDARIVGLPLETIALLSLPVCKECASKLSEMERLNPVETDVAHTSEMRT